MLAMRLTFKITKLMFVLAVGVVALPMEHALENILIRAPPSTNLSNNNNNGRSTSKPSVPTELNSDKETPLKGKTHKGKGNQATDDFKEEIMMYTGYRLTESDIAAFKSLRGAPLDPEYVANKVWVAEQAKKFHKGIGSSHPKKKTNTGSQQSSRKSPRYIDDDEATLTEKTTRDEGNSSAEGLAGIKETTGSQTGSSAIAGDNVSEDGGYTSDDTLVSQDDKSYTK